MNLIQAEQLNAKQIYQHKVEAQLGKLDIQIIGLKARVAQVKTTTNIKRYDKVDALSAKQQEAQAKLQMLKSANEEVWQEFKVGVESALHELQDTFNNALAQFKQSQIAEANPHLV